MTKSTIALHHNNLTQGSCKLLLKCLNKHNTMPYIQSQEYNIYVNNKIEHGCIYTVPTTNHIKSLWKDIQLHVPYLTTAHLHIGGKYDGPITNYINNTDMSNIIK
tara:strand:- start:902 stop:1216 length:315 start_codon:yes stop_codon:yes gene_type:complete